MSSSGGRRKFTAYETELIKNATINLHERATRKMVIRAIKRDKDCREYGIISKYTPQQLREKFKNIKKHG